MKQNRNPLALLVALAFASGATGVKAVEPSEPKAPPDNFYFERPTVPLSLRPPSALRSCLRDVCVHSAADRAAEAHAIAAASQDIVETWLALKLMRPPPDGALGGDSRLDIYLEESLEEPAAQVDPGSMGVGFDGATGFVVSPTLGPSCEGRARLARALGGLFLRGRDGAVEVVTESMLAGYWASLAAPCSVIETAEVDRAMRHPEWSMAGARRGAPPPAGFLFPTFLEETYGDGKTGELSFALASIASQSSGAGPLLDEPDILDALRITQRKNESSLADTWLDFAVARAFLGSRSDGAHFQDGAAYGAFGRVAFEWAIPWSTLPRTVMPKRPVESLGAAYFMIGLDRDPATTEVTVVAEWEEPVAFRFAAVSLDAEGTATSRTDFVPVFGEFRIERSLRDFHNARYLLIVALNEGEARRDQPFDPGRPHEDPHALKLVIYGAI